MNAGRRALPSARIAAPASRNSLTKRSCNVLLARSTRPLAGLELAQMMSMLSACRAPAKLGHPVTAKRTWMVDPENPMLVAVERDRLAPGLQIGTSRMEIGKGRLALDKLQMHQSAGRVVDKHQLR